MGKTSKLIFVWLSSPFVKNSFCPCRLVYKERYENFKRNALIIIISLTFLCFWFKDYTRLPESFLQFMLAWFYLALTVREHILIKNGSKLVYL